MLQRNSYDPKTYPVFYQSLQTYFPGALPLEDYMQKTYTYLSSQGFEDENTMGMAALCRDEITDPLLNEVIKYWGKTFNCCSLAGFVLMGKTGLAAATDHVPIADGIRRFTFLAMPHIAISKEGEMGKVYREGIHKASHACGSLEAIVKELESGYLNLKMDTEDLEQSIIRQKILSALRYGDKLNLVEMTKLACQIIADDVHTLLSSLDASVFKYAVMTGIQIHGPVDMTWIYPHKFYVVGADLPGNKQVINLS